MRQCLTVLRQSHTCRAKKMNNTDNFIAFVEHICSRRSMYVIGGSFYEVCAYLSGYAHALPDSPISGEGWEAFNKFVCAAFRFPNKYAWPYVVKQCCRDDDEATERLRSILTEFAQRSKTESYEDIVRDMLSRASTQEEGEPEKTWRRFSRAILRGRREEIEPLIQEHPNAEVLWSVAYPDEVVPLLDEIAESYPVNQVSGSEDAGKVTIITDFGLIPLSLIGGTWRIDATKVIDCWKANRNGDAQQSRGTDVEDRSGHA